MNWRNRMKRPAWFLTLAVLLIISISCNKKNKSILTTIEVENASYPLTLIKEKEIKIDAVIKGIPVLAKIESPNRIFVKTYNKEGNTEFLAYNTDLELEKKNLIFYGQGPNECLQTLVMGGDENNIIIYDGMSQKYYLYDGDLKNRKTLKAKQPLESGWIPHGVNFSEKNNAFLTCLSRIIKPGVFEYHLHLRKIEDNGIKDTEILKIENNVYSKKRLFIAAHPIHFSLINDNIYILRPDEYRITKMNLEGIIVKEARVANLGKVRFTNQERELWIEERGLKKSRFTCPEYLWHACWILELGNGIAIGRRDNYKPLTKEWGDADYFDMDLNYLGKIKLPWFSDWNFPDQVMSDIFFQNKGNMLFFIETRETENDEEFWLTRWRIRDEK
jgi:hypothetical protein